MWTSFVCGIHSDRNVAQLNGLAARDKFIDVPLEFGQIVQGTNAERQLISWILLITFRKFVPGGDIIPATGTKTAVSHWARTRLSKVYFREVSCLVFDYFWRRKR